jgi:hypothetical protein
MIFIRVPSHAWRARKERSPLWLVTATKDGDRVQCNFNYVTVCCYIHPLFDSTVPNFVLSRNSISVELYFANVFALKHHVSAAYVILLFSVA